MLDTVERHLKFTFFYADNTATELNVPPGNVCMSEPSFTAVPLVCSHSMTPIDHIGYWSGTVTSCTSGWDGPLTDN